MFQNIDILHPSNISGYWYICRWKRSSALEISSFGHAWWMREETRDEGSLTNLFWWITTGTINKTWTKEGQGLKWRKRTCARDGNTPKPRIFGGKRKADALWNRLLEKFPQEAWQNVPSNYSRNFPNTFCREKLIFQAASIRSVGMAISFVFDRFVCFLVFRSVCLLLI